MRPLEQALWQVLEFNPHNSGLVQMFNPPQFRHDNQSDPQKSQPVEEPEQAVVSNGSDGSKDWNNQWPEWPEWPTNSWDQHQQQPVATALLPNPSNQQQETVPTGAAGETVEQQYKSSPSNPAMPASSGHKLSVPQVAGPGPESMVQGEGGGMSAFFGGGDEAVRQVGKQLQISKQPKMSKDPSPLDEITGAAPASVPESHDHVPMPSGALGGNRATNSPAFQGNNSTDSPVFHEHGNVNNFHVQQQQQLDIQPEFVPQMTNPADDSGAVHDSALSQDFEQNAPISQTSPACFPEGSGSVADLQLYDRPPSDTSAVCHSGFDNQYSTPQDRLSSSASGVLHHSGVARPGSTASDRVAQAAASPKSALKSQAGLIMSRGLDQKQQKSPSVQSTHSSGSTGLAGSRVLEPGSTREICYSPRNMEPPVVNIQGPSAMEIQRGDGPPQGISSPRANPHPNANPNPTQSPARTFQESPPGGQSAVSPLGQKQGGAVIDSNMSGEASCKAGDAAVTPEDVQPAQTAPSYNHGAPAQLPQQQKQQKGLDISASPIQPHPQSDFQLLQPANQGQEIGSVEQDSNVTTHPDQDPQGTSITAEHAATSSAPVAATASQQLSPQQSAPYHSPQKAVPSDADYKQSLSYQLHKNRQDNNMSQAITLWENIELGKGIVKLAPAAPSLLLSSQGSDTQRHLKSPTSKPQPLILPNILEEIAQQQSMGLVNQQQDNFTTTKQGRQSPPSHPQAQSVRKTTSCRRSRPSMKIPLSPAITLWQNPELGTQIVTLAPAAPSLLPSSQGSVTQSHLMSPTSKPQPLILPNILKEIAQQQSIGLVNQQRNNLTPTRQGRQSPPSHRQAQSVRKTTCCRRSRLSMKIPLSQAITLWQNPELGTQIVKLAPAAPSLLPSSQGSVTQSHLMSPTFKPQPQPQGQLVSMFPNDPKDGQPVRVSIQPAGPNQPEGPELLELKAFPGPLVKGETHQKNVQQFCTKKAAECRKNGMMVDRESAELIWTYLQLLIKQNGMVVGTDIADLLLEDHEPSTAAYAETGMNISLSTIDTTSLVEDTSTAGVVTSDRTQINRSQTMATNEIIDRFRNLLLHGQKKDALEFAMRQKLWGNAVLLASKMDPDTLASVLTRLTNVAERMKDPLGTLFQLMSGRQPAAVTLVSDDKWGDWRPHLAMILSNPTNKKEVDRKSIITLGDSLASRGCLHASHFCYLMAHQSFGTYNRESSKMVLIGANHSLPFATFASAEAIQCTEVYEYAQSLRTPGFHLPTFQLFKYLYAVKLEEWGLREEALHYCEVLSQTLQLQPSLYDASLINNVHDLACRLENHDPQRLHMGEDMEDPVFISHLARLAQGFQEGTTQQMLGSQTPLRSSSTRASSEVGAIINQTKENRDQKFKSTYYGQGQDLSGAAANHGLVTHKGSAFQQTYNTEQHNMAEPAKPEADGDRPVSLKDLLALESRMIAMFNDRTKAMEDTIKGGYLAYQQQQQEQQQQIVWGTATQQYQQQTTDGSSLQDQPEQQHPEQQLQQQEEQLQQIQSAYDLAYTKQPQPKTKYLNDPATQQHQQRTTDGSSLQYPPEQQHPEQQLQHREEQLQQSQSAYDNSSLAYTKQPQQATGQDETGNNNSALEASPRLSGDKSLEGADANLAASMNSNYTQSSGGTEKTLSGGGGNEQLGSSLKGPNFDYCGVSAQQPKNGGGSWLGGILKYFRTKKEIILPDNKEPTVSLPLTRPVETRGQYVYGGKSAKPASTASASLFNVMPKSAIFVPSAAENLYKQAAKQDKKHRDGTDNRRHHHHQQQQQQQQPPPSESGGFTPAPTSTAMSHLPPPAQSSQSD